MSILKSILLFLFYFLPFYSNAQVSHPPFQYVGSDSVITYVSGRYKANTFLREILMGKNYRNVWSQPVTLPIFRLSQSGFKIDELGGGMQTKSLKLEDKDGREWALRTLDKDVSGALPTFLEGTIAAKVTQDQISAAMPYSPLIIGHLAQSVGVVAAKPTLYFIADDPALGQYRNIFAGTVCMLEDRNAAFKNTDNTEDMLRKVQRSNDHLVQQKALLRARLLDMLIADWDRHFDNWRWGIRDSAGLHYYVAVPRDRDWAFYYSGGLVPKLARLVALRFFINFSKDLNYIKSLNYKGQRIDKIFLHGLSAADWQETIQQVQQGLTDEVISSAVQHLPTPIFNLVGNSFIDKLKNRRNTLEKAAMKYYRHLSSDVQIEGSSEKELFSVTAADNGFRLQIFQLNKNNEKGPSLFDRTFVRSETYRVVLNGLGDEDSFVIDEKVDTKIRLKLNGGEGKDSYQLAGNIRSEVFDKAVENNQLSNKNSSKVSFR